MNDAETKAPLVASMVDLRCLEYMPLFCTRLLDSDAMFALIRPDQDRMLPWHGPLKVQLGNDEVYDYPPDTDRAKLISAITEIVQRKRDALRQGCATNPSSTTWFECLPDAYTPEQTAEMSVARALPSADGQLRIFLLLALSPPIVVLALGVSIAWVVLGFRSAPRR
jgi:hypothetical protein